MPPEERSGRFAINEGDADSAVDQDAQDAFAHEEGRPLLAPDV